MVIAAILLPVLMAFCAFAIDVGSLYAQRRALQNAADAAALAGAREALQQQLGSTTADPKAKALDFAKRNGIDMTGSVCPSDGKATLSTNVAGVSPQTWQVTTSRQVKLTFGSFVGAPTQCVQATAEAKASSEMLDIMLSLDTTKSMTLSGPNDFQYLREAVVKFIEQVNPDAANPRSSKVGIARWAGLQCVYSGGSYTNPCKNDLTVLSDLSTNKANLTKLANGASSGCPTAPSQPSGITAPATGGSLTKWACTLQHASYTAPGITGFVYPDATGTKIPNAFFALNNNNSTWQSSHAWSTGKGGRTDAKKDHGAVHGWPQRAVADEHSAGRIHLG
jgi:Flp pilus assembly protein TadG